MNVDRYKSYLIERFSDEDLSFILAGLPKLNEANNTEIPEKFEKLWKDYQRPEGKGSKKKALAAFKRLSVEKRELAVNNVKAFMQANPNSMYRPHVERYISYERFLDDNVKASKPILPNEKREEIPAFKGQIRNLSGKYTPEFKAYVEQLDEYDTYDPKREGYDAFRRAMLIIKNPVALTALREGKL